MKLNLSKSKETGVKFIGGAVLLALVAAGVTYYSVSTVTAKIPVYAAKSSITKGDPLTKDLFNVVYLPKGGVPQDVLTSKTNLDTRITNTDMSVGDILRNVNTTDLEHDNPSLLSARLRALENKGLVGGEIPIDSMQGMLNGMKAGDRIYLVATKKQVQAGQPSPEGASTTASVVGTPIVNEATVVGVRSATDGNAALIIAMAKEDAVKVAIAREEGKVYAYLLPFGGDTLTTGTNQTSSNTASINSTNTNNSSNVTPLK